MENVDKLRVLLQHWIDHNKGHAEEFGKWQTLMADDGKGDIASSIGAAIKEMAKVNLELEEALRAAGGPSEAVDKDGGHHHHHHDGKDHHHH